MLRLWYFGLSSDEGGGLGFPGAEVLGLRGFDRSGFGIRVALISGWL